MAVRRLSFPVSLKGLGMANSATPVGPQEAYRHEFPLLATSGIDALEARSEWSSAELFQALFHIARRDFDLDNDRFAEGQSCYAPCPLVDRLLRIVAQVCKDCLTVTMQCSGREQFSGRETNKPAAGDAGDEPARASGPPPVVRLPIPAGLNLRGDEDERLLITIVARFVLSASLNQAMSWGFTSCDIAVTGPSSPPAPAGESVLGAGEWRKLLKRTYEEHHFERFSVPAGLTGLWQVTARARSPFVEALELDVLYARSWSFWGDILLLLKTPVQVLRPKATR